MLICKPLVAMVIAQETISSSPVSKTKQENIIKNSETVTTPRKYLTSITIQDTSPELSTQA